ncbi:MAG: hypothetical protein JWM41_37 [Gemmatimonadetes bacterium]|nr:hypothetical protein [Gemmatimonadota bacterium]
MSRGLLSAFAAFAICALAAPAVRAQSIFDIGARIAPQFHSYKIDSPSNEKISEFAVPLFVLVPVSSSFSVDVGTSFSRSHVEQTTAGKTTTSSISGLTDTQVRGNYVLGNDFVVLTAGVNLPTGRSTVTSQQQLAASLIGSDFLSFPISNMGTGFGGTGGVAMARPLGDWNLGLGLSMRRSARYDPYDAAGGTALHYQPGNEYRARAGVDRALGTGRVAVGLTYSTFGNDNLSGSVYNTGNRWLTQASLDNTLGRGQLSLSAWNLFRTRGTLVDSSALGHENITNATVAYGISAGSMVIEPNVEGRVWMQEGLPTSALTTLGIRTQMSVMGFSVLPSVGYSLGRLAAVDANNVSTTATLTGLHATLAIRIR